MNSANAIVDRYVNFSDYLRSSEFRENPTANIFTPLRKVRSAPARDNHLPLCRELNAEIAQYLRLKDFIAFSSINVDNYFSLRSNHLLVRTVVENELPLVSLDRLEDLQQKSRQYHYDLSEEIALPEHCKVKLSTLASSPGPARLILVDSPVARDYREIYFYKLFQHLCLLANNDSLDVPSRAHICSLTIDINNGMGLKESNDATLLALLFIDIALQIHRQFSIEGKEEKLCSLARMIASNELHTARLGDVYFYKTVLHDKSRFDWDTFITGLMSGNAQPELSNP